MQALKQVQSGQNAPLPNVVSRWDAFFNDLGLLISVAIARLLVWRTIRRRSQERAARLKHFKLIHGGNAHPEKSVIAS